jgi:hypothetical protein
MPGSGCCHGQVANLPTGPVVTACMLPAPATLHAEAPDRWQHMRPLVALVPAVQVGALPHSSVAWDKKRDNNIPMACSGHALPLLLVVTWGMHVAQERGEDRSCAIYSLQTRAVVHHLPVESQALHVHATCVPMHCVPHAYT